MIVRPQRRPSWLEIDRRAVDDTRLSFRARGVLAWLLAKPDDWKISAEVIARQGREGRDAIREALTELERHGYLQRRKVQDERGHWRVDHVLHEIPLTTENQAPVTITDDGKPVAGNPGDGKPVVLATKETNEEERAPSVVATARSLVRRSSTDADAVVRSLTESYGVDRTSACIRQLTAEGAAFTWASELRKEAAGRISRDGTRSEAGAIALTPRWELDDDGHLIDLHRLEAREPA